MARGWSERASWGEAEHSCAVGTVGAAELVSETKYYLLCQTTLSSFTKVTHEKTTENMQKYNDSKNSFVTSVSRGKYD